MNWMGREVTPQKLLRVLRGKLAPRPAAAAWDSPDAFGAEIPIEPHAFYVEALADNADPTVPLPVQTHRGGVGLLVVVLKKVYRKVARPLINETLARQGLFNANTRDSVALLSAEVLKLKAQVAQLERPLLRKPRTKPLKTPR